MKEIDVITKWQSLGFLDTVKNKRMVSLACEILANHLLDKKNRGKYHDDIDTLIFPVIINIFKDVDGYIFFDTIKDTSLEILEALSSEHSDIIITQEWINRENLIKDVEAEFVKRFCDNYKI